METTATKIEGLRAIRPIPRPGQRFLSINAAIADPWEVWKIAQDLGLSPELVQIRYRHGTEIHVLLWKGAIEDTPPTLDEAFDLLSDRFDDTGIRYAAAPVKAA